MENNVRKITREWLRTYGYEGLFNEVIFCGCEVDDLMPCGEPSDLSCVAGYKTGCDEATCENGGGCHFHIVKDKPAPPEGG